MRLTAALGLLALLSQTSGAFLFRFESGDRAAGALKGMLASFEAGDCRAVADSADSFLALKPSAEQKRRAYAALGPCYERLGYADRAIVSYSLALALFPEDEFFASRLAGIYLEAGFFAKALEYYSSLLKSRPGDPGYSLGAARAYRGLGWHSKAADAYAAAVKGDVRDPGLPREYARALFDSGRHAELLNFTEPAALDTEMAALRSRAYARRGDTAAAARALEDCAAARGFTRRLALELGFLRLAAGEFPAAAVLADELIARDPGDKTGWFLKGASLYGAGSRSEASRALERSYGGDAFVDELAHSLARALKEGR